MSCSRLSAGQTSGRFGAVNGVDLAVDECCVGGGEVGEEACDLSWIRAFRSSTSIFLRGCSSVRSRALVAIAILSSRDAAELFSTEVVPGSSIRQCERWIKEIRPRVKATLSTLQALTENTDK